MSTRSNIAVEHCNGTVSNIYIHSDGYLSGVGATLHKYWPTTRDVARLTKLGDCSSLGENLTDTIAYHRDRGDEECPARKDATLEEYLNHDRSWRQSWGYEYCYVFTRKQGWLVKAYDEPWRPLHLALVEEKLLDED